MEMTNAQRVSLRSLRELAYITSPEVQEPEPLYPSMSIDHCPVVVNVKWGKEERMYLIEPGGCIARVMR